tara:strand:+ start:6545 stop:16627 length:10083 start_codon:yes stop_codon:yes gene_type:complete
MGETNNSNNATSENQREINNEEYADAFKSLDENFNIPDIAQSFSDTQEQIDPFNAGIAFQEESPTFTEFDQGVLGDFISGVYNTLIVGSVEGMINLAPTISNAITETEVANNWIDSVSKFAYEFELGYSDDFYKPIEKFDDINATHFTAGLGNGIGFVIGIGKFAKAGQLLSKSGRLIRKGEKLLEGTSKAFKSGAKARNSIDDIVKAIFKKGKTSKLKKVPKFKEGLKGKKRVDMLNKLKKLEQTGESSLKNSARFGSFMGGTTMMYGMVQEEALAAGLDRTDAARFALTVAGVVSLTEGAALEAVGAIPALAAKRQIVKAAAQKSFKGMAGKPPSKILEAFLPKYSNALKAADIAKGVMVESFQEFTQTYIEEGAKQFYDVVFADKDAKVGKGKFGQEVFDLDADSFGDFFLDGEDATRTFTNSVFAGILGGIIGGGMAGLQLNAIGGERNIGNESAFNLIADDVINKKTKNRDKINQALTKAYNDDNISKQDIDATNEILDEMEAFVQKNNLVKQVEDPIAQYQMFNLFKAGKVVESKTKTKEQLEKELQGELDKTIEERLIDQENKNSLFDLISSAININYEEIYRTEKAETKDPDEFNDKVLAYQYLAEQVDGNVFTTEEEVLAELDKIYSSEFKKQYQTIEKTVKEQLEKQEERGDFLNEVEEEEFNEFKDNGNISKKRINYLAQKLKNKKDFNEYEQKMYDAKKSEVEQARDFFIKEEKEAKAEQEKAKEENKFKPNEGERKKEEKGEKEENKEKPFNEEEYKKYLETLTEEQLKEEFDNVVTKSDSNVKEKLDSINKEDTRRIKNKKPTGKTKEEIKAEKEEAKKKAKEKTIKDKINDILNIGKSKKSGKNYSKKSAKDVGQDLFSAVLGAMKSAPNYNSEEAKTLFKEYAKTVHPDKNNQTSEREALATAILSAMTEARDKGRVDVLKKLKELFDTEIAKLPKAEKETKKKEEQKKKEREAKEQEEEQENKEKEEREEDKLIEAIKKESNFISKSYEKIKIIEKDYENSFFFKRYNKEDVKSLEEEIKEANERIAYYKEEQKKRAGTSTTTDTTTEQKTGEDVEEETTPTKKKKIDLSKLTSVDKDQLTPPDDPTNTNPSNNPNGNTQTDEEIEKETLATQKANKNEKTADKVIPKINNLPSGDINLEQRKNITSEINDSQKIIDNNELFENIKEHFKKMFPKIPVQLVDKLFNKYGVEILGQVSKDGITISEEAYQNTLVHEFAHVYIDLIADKEIVKNALEWIKTTKFFQLAKQAYPSYTTEKQAMEALVQAMSENSIPKLEGMFSNSQLTKWGSIAKKLWRTIKRMFTGVNKRNYIDFLSDSLIYNSKPIMVETNYLENNALEQRKAIGVDVANFNNNFLSRKTKQFVINSLLNEDKNITAVKVLSNLRIALISIMNDNEQTFPTVALNAKYNELIDSDNKVIGYDVKYNELSDSKKISVLLEQTVYESGVSYLEHMAYVTEQLVKLPTEVKEDFIDEQINRDQNKEEDTGKVEKENIKGDKKMTSSIASLIGTLVDSDGKKIHEDLVFSYIAKVAQNSVTNQEVVTKIKNDSKKGNNIANALLSTLMAAKQYDNSQKTNVYQTLLIEVLSQQSVVYKSINIKTESTGDNKVEVYKTSASRIKANRTREFKKRILDPRFISQIITRVGKGGMNIQEIINERIKTGKGYFLHNQLGTFDVQQVDAIGELLFGLNEGEFDAVHYVNWLIKSKQNETRNKTTGDLIIRARELNTINNISDPKAKKQAASNFFMVEILNTFGEQQQKKKNKANKSKNTSDVIMSGGAVSSLMSFAAFQYDGDIHNANMFINSSGNSISTTRLGSYLNRAFTNIAKKTEEAKKKNNKQITVEGLDGRNKKVFLFRNNPVFAKLMNDGIVNQFIDDAVNYVGEKATEHGQQNEIDLLITQLAYFATNQNRDSYDQKLMINDRSHSNWLSVNRLDANQANTVLLQQRNVDQSLLNENYKLLDKAGKKKYLEEFNKISLNYAYDEKGKVKVIAFKTDFINKKFPSDFTKNQVEGFNKKIKSIEQEKKTIIDTLNKTKLTKAFSKDHVGNKKLYTTLDKLITAFTINDRINRLAINDIVSEPIAYRLVKGKYNKKKGKTVYTVDSSNVIKRNSGFDSLGTKVNLSHQNTNKTVKTIVFEMKDDQGEDISNSFLFRGSQMTKEIQKQLGERKLNKIGDNSKDGEYMITEDGRNIYHKNSSINSMENEEGENNLIAMAKGSMGENYKESRFYKMYEMLQMLEEEYGDEYHIQVIDVESTKGSKLYDTPSSIDNLYKNIKDKNWKAIDKSSYIYDSENFYIPFDENKKLSKKELAFQEARFATQLVKILTNFTNSDIAKENSQELEQLMVELLEEQIGLNENSNNYKDSVLGNVLFQTNSILIGLKDSIDQLQDPDTIQMLDEMIAYNKSEGKKLDKARKTIKRLSEIEEGLSKEQQEALTKAEDIVNNKKTINKIDHPAMLQQLKQVIISKIKSKGVDLRLPGAYLKMVPDIDGRLKSESLGDNENEILLPWSMFGKTKEQAEKFLKEQNEKGGVFVPGVRVPASDAISTLNARVVGFIDDANMAVLPHGFTVKSDADHDGDKVFIYRMDLQTKEGKTVIKENSKKNKIYNLMNELMQTDDYKKRIKDGSINLDVFEKQVKDINDELKDSGRKGLREDFNFGSATEMNETDARLSFGEKAVGILAVAGKLNAALYQAGVVFKGNPKVTIMGQEIDLEEIDAPKTANDIAMLLQAALDISKKPVLLTAGINASNINVVVAMLISGIKLKNVIKFINQDNIIDFYTTDNTSDNSYNKKKNKDQLKINLKDRIINEKNTAIQKELETLMYFTELGNELNTVTSIAQLDGKIPNDGYLLRDVKSAFNLIKNKNSKTKLRYNELANKPLNQHYEKLVDFALDTLSHHFITENESYYKEIEQVKKSREAYGVKEFDMKTEKRRIDDMFALMVSQKLDIEEEISALEYGDSDSLLIRLASMVAFSQKAKFQNVSNTENVLQKKYIKAQKELVPQDNTSQNNEQYELEMAFRSLSMKIEGFNETFGNMISNEVKQATWNEKGQTTEGITKKQYVKQYIKSLQDQNLVIPVTENMLPKLIDVAIKYDEYLDSNMSEMNRSKESAKNKFLQLLQLTTETNPLTDVEERILTGKNDIRYLTTTEKRLAKEDFLKLPLETQKDFKAYQMLKFGLSNKLGSLISIMPSDFTVEYLKYISNIKSDGVKENKIYELNDLEIAENYNDLYYPLKKYKSANKLVDNEGQILKDIKDVKENNVVFLKTELTKNNVKTYQTVKGKPGVRFEIEGDSNIYEFQQYNKDESIVSIIDKDSMAKKTNEYTTFRTESLSEASDVADNLDEAC